MLMRQKTILAFLTEAKQPLDSNMLVMLMFLLRHETEVRCEKAFYDFVPYKSGPFSFALYHELTSLRRDGFVALDDTSIHIEEGKYILAKKSVKEIPGNISQALEKIVDKYAGQSHASLLDYLYARYPWYATRSESELNPQVKADEVTVDADTGVYTVGYQGRSIDSFLNHLLKNGIRLIIDVRANPCSRQYGFAKSRMSETGKRLGIDYRHMPSCGIPNSDRRNLTDSDSYQRLLNRYERESLPKLSAEVDAIADLMTTRPATLLCMENDADYCHRSRLARAISQHAGLGVVHL